MDVDGLIVVADRLPTTWTAEAGWARAPGGLVTALEGVARERGCRWIGYSPVPDDVEQGPVWHHGPLERVDVASRVHDRALAFASEVLWPALHGLRGHIRAVRGWDEYVAYNERVAEVVAERATDDAAIWIHDYQLFLVPGALRRIAPSLRIGLSVHTPFDDRVMATIGRSTRLRESMRASDLIGVQTSTDRRAIERFLGAGTSLRPRATGGTPPAPATIVSPVSIDIARIVDMQASPLTRTLVERERARTAGRRLIVGVDRLDYTKGIPERLAAYDRAFSRGTLDPDGVRIVQIAQPTRATLAAYRSLRLHTERSVHEIAARWSRSDGSCPIEMVIDHVPRRRVIALLTVADICIVVPKRDGMNLVAKEFSIANADTAGVLVLGEGAGAVHELGPGSVTVDHCDPRSIHDGLCRALDTSESERRAMAIERATAVRAWTASDWSHHFLDTLTTRTHTTGTRTTGPVSDEAGLGTSAITG